MAIRIKSRGGESVEQMLRRFKKLCEKEGLTKDVKKNAYYEKPSERRRRALRKTIKRAQKVEEGPPLNRGGGGSGGRGGAGSGRGGAGGGRGGGGGGGGRR
ncbi:MAG: 30S ribosomal protein S21 [Phycisphaerae bacterium]|nr:30S ribosomal protein S21 [Phycisphaerae bacterium]